MSVISNTTVISNLSSVGQLDLLRRLYETLYISTQVHKEIQTGLKVGYRSPVADLTTLLLHR